MHRKTPSFGRTLRAGTLFLAVAFAAAFASSALAKGLPKTFAWTAYGVKSSGYAQSVAIGNAFNEKGYKLRVLPGKNDVSRMAPLKSHQVQFSAMGVGSYLAQEGVQDFGSRQWGPQELRMILASWANTNTAQLPTAKDANIRQVKDVKGKRCAWVVGSPALNTNLTAWLAFAGLTWDDVVKVEVPGFGAAMRGLIDGTIDAAIASTDSSLLYELNGSPRGLYFPPLPHNDKAGWKRLQSVAPWYAPHMGTAGAGLSPEHPHEGASYGYPILVTYKDMDDQAVYELTKLLDTEYDNYKNGHPGGVGWAIKRQNFEWIHPYHPGAIKYFKEIGAWNASHQKYNDMMVHRQEVLVSAWKKYAANATGDRDAFLAGWMKARAAALKGAGFDPIWDK